jgi:hypothetical protein
MTHHNHHHDHEHGHDHHHADHSGATLTFEDKFIKLLDHWVKHNDDHAQNYRDWAHKAQHQGLPEVETLLQDAARLTDDISVKFNQAAELIKKSKA